MYESFYGLTGKPFQLNPDPSFFFSSKGHASAYSYLKYGVFQSEGFIVITGEIGAGKTTLVRALLEELDARRVVAAQLVSTRLDADNLLKAVATAFGLAARGEDKAILLAQIEAFLTQLMTEGKRALLVVDEAQNLTAEALEELRMLSNFQYGDRALMQSFLVGQPELRATLRSPAMQQFRQRVIASYHLGPMDKAETRAYIEHRLQRVGWRDDPQFDPEVFARIFVHSGGVPRRINQLANRLMLSAFLSESHAISASDVDGVAEEIGSELGAEQALASVTVLPGVARREGKEAVSQDIDHASLVETVQRIDANVNLLIELMELFTRSGRVIRNGGSQGG